MDIVLSTQGAVMIVAVSGRLDSASSPAAQEKLADLVTSGAHIVVDMHACDYVSSAGLRVLLWCAKAAAREGARIVVCDMATSIAEVMEMTGFGGLFPSFDGIDDAVRAAGEGA